MFSGRDKSLIVDGSGSGYLKSVGNYVHLNPARAKRVAAEHYGEERAETAEALAERIIVEELKRGAVAGS